MSSLELYRQEAFNPRGYKISISSLLLSTLAINTLALALPVMTLQVYDRILPNPGSGTLPVLISGVCLAVILEAALRLARAYVLGRSGAAFEHRLSCAAMRHILWTDLSHTAALGMGEHLHRMGAISKLKDFHNGYSLVTLFELAFVPLFMGLIIYIAGPLAAVPAVILMVFTIISLMQGQRLRQALKARDISDDRRYNFLIEGLEGVHTLKSFALENTFARRYEALEKDSTFCNYRVTETTAGAFNAGAVFSHAMVAAVIACGAVFAMNGQITTGALIATVMLSGRIMQPIQRALALWAKYQDYTLSRQKVEAIFETPRHLSVPRNDNEFSREGTLELQNVSLKNRNNDEGFLLRNINLNLKRGECMLLTAGHGEGKTTLLELISGIYPPSEGEVIIDGINSLRYPSEEITRHVGYIQTEGLVFRGSIRDNMTCFGLIPEQQAQEMAALLHVNRDVARLPSGFDTLLNGNSTDNIPPGLKQRIAMVRVLAPKPRIILFDSADRALDREGYDLIYKLLARLKGKATMILISDDHNIRALADRSFTLNGGFLIETQDIQNNAHHPHTFRELRP